MSVENPETANGTINDTKPLNGDQPMNGLTNGHIVSGGGDHGTSSKHKSSSKDKHRDKDHRSSHKSSKHSSSNRDKDSERHKHASSSSGKDKHRDKDKDKSKSSSSHKSSRDKDRERDKDKDKDKSKEHRSSEKDKEKNHDKDRERTSKDDKLKESSSDNKDRDRKKEHKSSSGDKDRRDRSDRDKDKSSSNKTSSSNHKSSSHHSSSHKHSSSHTSKSRSDRDKHHSSSSKDKDRHRSDKNRHRSNDKDKLLKESQKEIKQEYIDRINEIGGYNETQMNTMRELKVELEMLPNHYNNQTCLDYGNNSIKEENKSPMKLKNLKPKDESLINISQASSCDYSLSQFRDDEPNFTNRIKREDYYDDCQNEMTMNSTTDPLGLNNDDEEDEESGRDDPDFNGAGEMDEEDIVLSKRKAQVIEADSEDDVPLLSRKKIKKEDKTKAKKNKKKREMWEDEEDYDEKPKQKKIKKEKMQTNSKPALNESPTKGRKKKEDEPDDVWRWWEEEKRDDGVKWNFLEHRGPVFAPLYERLPPKVQFYYDGRVMHLSEETEEVACFYAKMLNHDYVTKKQFNDNFFKDFRKSMTSKEKDVIKDLRKCNFQEMHAYFQTLSEKNKNRSKEEKLAVKDQNEALIKEYGFCTIDGHKEKIGNFKLEPPGLFRGRGEHPKMGLVKRRIRPEDVLINCSKNSKIPEPPRGHKWKEVRHDNSVTWLASWVENVQGQVKYIMLNPSSKLKGEKDHQKYEIARRLHKQIDKIRAQYRDEWKSKEMRIRQRGVALYFIDKLALRAGNEKDEDQADTVGCCSLRVEHVALHKKMNDKENVVVFDFLGKDSIRYYNEVEVEKRVFKNLELFMENKKDGDELFDRLNTSILNDHLRDLMEGLTAKVFRTYNASITLQNQLNLLTDADSSIHEKLLAYNRANRAVAVLCNHQRSVPKSHEKSMENLKEKIRVKRELIDDTETEYQDLKKQGKRGSVKEKLNADKKFKQLERLKEQLKKLELQETDRDENKTIALGTSKLNYLDPRISVAWCKKNGVPLEKIFNKTQRDKFRWAIHMADENYIF